MKPLVLSWAGPMYTDYQTPKTHGYKRIYSLCRTAPKFACVAGLLLSVSACSVTSKTSALDEDNSIVTSSVTKPTKPEGVEGNDAELIKTVVVDADAAKPKTSELAWNNPDTGNSGTIVAIDKFVGSHGQKCKKFQTTVDSFMGVSLYDGETCEVKKGSWVLSWFTRR